jgi:hypothetical protein
VTSRQRSLKPVSVPSEGVKRLIHQRDRSGGEIPQSQAATDAQIRAAWTPVAQDHLGRWCFNPFLDLPMQSYAGMDKVKLWEMFVYRLTEGEVQNLLLVERSWAGSGEGPAAGEADVKENREAPLRPSDLAAEVIVWLWHNGLHREAVSVLERIWQTMRDRQQRSARECIPWPAQSVLDGFRAAAHRDWNDHDQAEFEAMFRDLHVDKKIEQGLDGLTG